MPTPVPISPANAGAQIERAGDFNLSSAVEREHSNALAESRHGIRRGGGAGVKSLRFVKVSWPEGNAPSDEPSWFFYEIDDAADAVVRSVWLYADGRLTRNSIEIEERGGKCCPSLIDCSIAQGFEGVNLQLISQQEFSKVWDGGVDTPFWSAG